MKLQGTRSFDAPRGTVWEVLNSPQQMAEIMPGVESFDVVDDRHWKANVKIPLGLGGMRMSINFDKLEENEPDFAKLHAKGTGVGALMDMENVLAALDRQVQKASGVGEGAEAGIHPASPEAYEPEPEAPTHSTEE